jgi:YidC/Oxa1 family membrane protein insertase
MDRNTLIGYLLIFAIFMGYMFYTNKNLEEARETQRIEDSIATENSRLDSLNGIVQTIEASKSDEELDTSSSIAKESVEGEQSADDTLNQEIASLPEKIFTLENAKLKLQLSSKGGRVAEVELKDYKTYDSTALLLFKKEGSFFSYTIPLKNRIIRTQELDFEIGEQD